MNYYNQLVLGLHTIINSYFNKTGSRCVLVLDHNQNFPLAIKDLCGFLTESEVEWQLFDRRRLHAVGITLDSLCEKHPSNLMLDALGIEGISSERLLEVDLVLVYKFSTTSWGSLTSKYMTIKKAKEVIDNN